MPRSIKLGVAALAVVILVAVVGLGAIGGQVDDRLERIYDVPPDAVDVSSDSISIERGRHLVSTVYFCQECHGEDLAGKVYLDDPLIGRITAPNLTAGKGGVEPDYGQNDWVLAIRHGIDTDGTPLVEMPSNIYYYLNDGDLAAVIAYLEQVPPVDNQLPESEIGPLQQLSILSDPSLLSAEVIDHQAPRPREIRPGTSAAYGEYLARACTVCHGEDFGGGPGAGAGLNLTPGGNLARWTVEDFMHAMRTGNTPRGYDLNPDLMPWERIADLTNDELTAIWLYLQILTEGGDGN